MRKELEIVIKEDGRDKGKKFLITEMPVKRSERWAMKLIVALINSGMLIPDEKISQGMAAVAEMGPGAMTRLNPEVVGDLMDEMLTCVQIVETAVTRKLTDDDVEEIRTLITLRAEVIQLHTGFSLGGPLSKLMSALIPPG